MRKIILFSILISFLILPACKDSSSPASPTTPTDSASTNKAPKIVSFNGPTSCKYGETYVYRVKGNDPDGDKVAFHFDIHAENWDTEWSLDPSPYIENNNTYEQRITWNYGIGEFTICVYCKDVHNTPSYHLQYKVDVAE